MAGFDEINLYAEPPRMLAGARQLAAVAAKLGPAGVRHRAVDLAPGAFAAVPNSAPAQQAWRQAATLLTTYLTTVAPAVEAMSEGVHRSSAAYRSGDARVSEMYRQLLLQLAPDGAGAGSDAALITKAGIPPAGTHPDAVHDWWQRLGAEARKAVLASDPALVGPLDGVPAEARDQANRALLETEMARQRQLVQEYEAQLRGPGGGGETVLLLSAAQDQLARLDPIHARLQADPQAFLLAISAEDDGRAIVALGNPDRAGQVLTYVPGMGSDLGTVPDQLGRMDAVLARAPEHTAAIVWLGYDAPDLGLQVGSANYATAAAEPLHRFQEGLRATHLGEPSNNVLLAHSYGTTAYGITAAEHGLSADHVYLIGSIGTTQESAHGFLGTSSENVYVTTHGRDIAHVPPVFGYYSTDPSGALFDARQLPGDFRGGPIDSHTEYLHRPDILDNIAGLLARRP